MASWRIGAFCVFLTMAAACLATSTDRTGGSTAGSTTGGAACRSTCPREDGGLGCSDPLTDDDNCGGCGIVCPDGEYCAGGACNCGLTTCQIGDGGAVCTDLMSDPLNCNACDHVCPTGENCVLGECDCQASMTMLRCTTDGGLACVDLTTGNDGGCWSPQCLNCPPANCCPSGGCADQTSDPFNCGACGNVCISGSCILGDAGTGVCNCPLPYAWCGPMCVDPYTDFDHCGSSCIACSAPATQCIQGHCR